MLAVDLIAACVLVGAAIWGYWAGFARALPVLGFAAGAAAGALAVPLLLNKGQESEWALVFAVPAALIFGGLAGALVERRTLKLRRRLRQIGVGSALGGAFIAAFSGLVAVWLLGAAFAQIGTLRDRIEGSEVVGSLNEVLPPPGPAARKTQRLFDPLPIAAGPRPQIAAPDPALVDDREVNLAGESVVKLSVLRTCGRSISGSGWFAAQGVVITNAHVVAASTLVSVQEQGGMDGSVGTVIHFDPTNDLAIVRVPDLLRVRPLALMGRPRAATAGAVIGFPAGEHRIRESRIGETTDSNTASVTTQELPPEFPRALGGRELTPFRGDTGPGGSGGPIVDGRGRVLGTVAVSLPGFGGYAVPNRHVRSALRNLAASGPAVSTGDCGPTADDDQRQ